jgi:hypothetical protein
MRQLEADKALVRSQKNLTDARKEELIAALEQERFRNRTAGLGPARVSDKLLSEGALTPNFGDLTTRTHQELSAMVQAEKIIKETGNVKDAMRVLEAASRKSTMGIAESFGQMADRTLQALDRMVGAIRGGGFLDILSSVINFGLQLGGMGLFGSNIQSRIQSAPGRANGGLVSSGRSYLVGERGPELFTPGATGFITPRAGNDNTRITVEASPYFDVRVNGQIVQAAPAIAQGGASVAQRQMGRAQSRRVPG